MLTRVFCVCFFSFLLATCCPPAGFAREYRVTVLYTTDTHGRLVSSDAVIGMDVIAALKKHTADALLVDAGDYLQGNAFVNLSEGAHAARLMKAAAYDAVTLGNHEFDFGPEALRSRLTELAASPNPVRVLSVNILNPDGTPFVRPADRKSVV